MIDEQHWLARLGPGPLWLPLAARCLREQQADHGPVGQALPFDALDEDQLEAALRERALECLERGRHGELRSLLDALAEGGAPSRQWAGRVADLVDHPADQVPGCQRGTGAWAALLEHCLQVDALLGAKRFRSAARLADPRVTRLGPDAGDAGVLPACQLVFALLVLGRPRDAARLLARARSTQGPEAPLESLIEGLAQVTREVAGQERQRRSLLVESFRHGGMLGRSPVFMDLLARLHRAAQHEDPVLLCGESGTGKELAARYLHARSARAQAPLVCLNCAGLPLSLAESELFGSAAGAFTGARERPGLVERAHGGTLFLDEFGAMPAALQAKLLRLLESGEYYRVGDARPRVARFRLLAATNEEQRLEGSEFRQDLRFRLGGEPLRLPPLRERLEDLPLLCQAFLLELPDGELAQDLCTPQAQALLAAHAWPGNIRELRFRLRDLVRLDPLRREQALKDLACRPFPVPPSRVAEGRALRVASEAAERSAVADALGRHPRDKRQAARELGISLPTLYARLKRWQEEDSGLSAQA